MGPVRTIRAKVRDNCCEDCRCGGSGCPGCPEVVTSFRAMSGVPMRKNDITKTGAMSRYHVKGGRPKSALGDDTPPDDFTRRVNDCLSAGGTVEVCQQSARAAQGWGLPGAPAAPPTTPAASSSGGFLSAFGTGLATLFGPKPGAVPFYPQTGMSDTTKILLLGGGALALVLLARR